MTWRRNMYDKLQDRENNNFFLLDLLDSLFLDDDPVDNRDWENLNQDIWVSLS